MNSGELLSQLNRGIDKKHHQKQTEPKLVQAKNQSPSEDNKEKQQPENKQQSHKQNKVAKKKITTQNSQVSQSNKDQLNRESLQNQTYQSNVSRISQQRRTKEQSIFKGRFNADMSSINQEEIGQSLYDILAGQIDRLISQPLAEVIQATIKQRERRTYVAFTENQVSYLSNLLKVHQTRDESSLLTIQQMMANRQSKTEEKLQDGQIYIDKQRSISTRDQVQKLEQLDVARLLKIKDGTIRSKLDLLQDKMFQLDSLENLSIITKKENQNMARLKEKMNEISDPKNFGLDSQKTKIANDYVKHLHQQKLLVLKKMRQKQQKLNKIEQQKTAEMKEAQQMKNIAKRESVTQRIQSTKEKKMQEAQNLKQQQRRINDMLKQYRKSLPLYKKKEKQFKKRYIVKEEKQRKQKLKQIKQYRNSMSIPQIKSHEQKYMQKRSTDNVKRRDQFKMMLNARKDSNSKQYFKGFFHDKVKVLDQQQRMKFYSVRESTRQKVERMTEFDKVIRQKHIPKIDPKKKEQLERVIQMDELKKKKVKKVYRQVQGQNGQVSLEAYYQEIPQIDHIKEGNKYMAISKSLAKKKDQSERYTEEPQIEIQSLDQSRARKSKSVINSWEDPSSIISQQKDMWRLRGMHLNKMTEEVNAANFQQIKTNLQLMDEKAKMKEELLRHKQTNAQQNLHQKGMLDQFYLDSIKNKIKLLNQ